MNNRKDFDSTSDRLSYKKSQYVVCNNCNRPNLSDSKYCDRCGKSIIPFCVSCGNSSNLPNSSFCNRCGNRIRGPLKNNPRQSLQPNPESKNASGEIVFLECLMIKHDIRLFYPSIFMKIENPEKDSEVFLSLKEIDKIVHRKQPAILTLSIRNSVLTIADLKKFTINEIKNILDTNMDAKFVGGFSTTISNVSAYQAIFQHNASKEILLWFIHHKGLYTITFKADKQRYREIVYLFEQIKNSIEFLSDRKS